MAPPGRRRISARSSSMMINLFTLLTLVLTLFSPSASASAVLGIDLGTEYLKGALVKPGNPFDIVLSKDSKRKEAAAIALKPGTTGVGQFPERFYGSDAVALASRFPGDVYSNLKALLGVGSDSSSNGGIESLESEVLVVDELRRRYPSLDVVTTAGSVAFQSKSLGADNTEHPFRVEELLAMQLKNLKENAETLAGRGHKIEDAVITIPAFYTAEEKAAVELAADFAGLNLLGLVSDGMAVGLNYATTRNFPVVSDGEKPEFHVVFDMGAGSTTATVMKFQGKTVKDIGRFNKTIQEVIVLGSGWDRTLGGDQLNSLILKDMVERFVQSPEARSAGISAETFKSHGRAMAKLWKEAERVRQVLSANSEASTSMESLYQDIDFKYKISRVEYESLTDEFAGKIADPVKQALEASGLSFADIDSVILHGGASRTPFVQKSLEDFAGGTAKIRSSVNADEAAVFGAVFRGASLSPSFRVKEIRSYEAASFTYGLLYNKDSKDGKRIEQNLFKPTSQVGIVKQVPFKQKDDFSFTFLETSNSGLGYDKSRASALSEVQTKNLTASVKQLVDKAGCALDDISTNFAIQLDPYDGLPSVVLGTVSCEGEANKDKAGGGVVADVKGFFGFGSGSKNSDQAPMQDGDSNVNEEYISSASSSTIRASDTEEAPEAPPAPLPSAEKEKLVVPVKRVETIKVDFTVKSVRTSTLPRAEISRMKERLSAFDTSDKNRRLREEKLNSLEAFTYRVRDLLEDESFVAASTDAERSELQKLQGEMSEWISSEAGAHADTDVLKSEHKKLKALVDPVEFRKSEAVKRPEMVKMLQENLEQTKNAAAMISATMEKAAEDEKEASAAAAAAAAESASLKKDDVDAPESMNEPHNDSSSDENTSSLSPSSSPVPQPPIFSDQDLASVTSKYDEITAWLAEKQAAQAQLAENVNPVLLSADIEAKARQLNEVALAMLQRQMKAQQKQQQQQAKREKQQQQQSSNDKGKDRKKEAEEKAETAERSQQENEEQGENQGQHTISHDEL